jgi:hypothetical protein
MVWVFLLHAAATLYMVGLIWFVQLVHYPLFAQVGEATFIDYQQAHMARTSLAVGPPMLAEVVGAVALCFVPLSGLPLWSAWTGLGLVIVIWASTAALQVPRHEALATGGFDAAQHAGLVATNWIRTVAWTVRGGLVIWMLGQLLQSSG